MAIRVVGGGSLRKDLQVVHVGVGVDEVNVAVDGSCIDGKIVEVCAKSFGGCNAVNHRKPHNNLVHQGAVLYPVDEVLALVGLEAGKRSHGKLLFEALCHHVIVLSSATLKIHTAHPAEHLAASLESSLINLAVILYGIDKNSVLVGELGDILGTLVPPHDGAMVLKGLHKCHGSGGGHRELLIIGELVAALFVD